jgi:hypothetical protein
MYKNLLILLLPDFRSTAESMDLSMDSDEDDEYSDAIAFQTGVDADEVEYEPGEEFEIPVGFSGSIIESDVEYIFKSFDNDDKVVSKLTSGRYHFYEDGITIEKIE